MPAPLALLRQIHHSSATDRNRSGPPAARTAPAAVPARQHLARLGRGLPRLSLLLLITAQLTDLATFGITVRALGIGGEIGPLRIVYRMAGFGGVALAKLLAVLAMIVILELYSRRTGGGRWLAFLVAAMGILGALTNVLSLL